MNIAIKLLNLMEEYKFDTLKDNKVALTKEEREIVMKEKAVWHNGPGGTESSAISKADVKGDIVYFTYTHRAFNSAPTLKGAIKCFHEFIKGTA